MTSSVCWTAAGLIVALGFVSPAAEGPSTVPLHPLGYLQGEKPTDALYRHEPDPLRDFVSDLEV